MLFQVLYGIIYAKENDLPDKKLCILEAQTLMYIPEKRRNHQISLFDFNQSCGMELDINNEWIKLAHAIP